MTNTPDQITADNQAAETARLARHARIVAAQTCGRTLAVEHLTSADLVRLQGAQGSLPYGFGLAEFGLEQHATIVTATLGDPPFPADRRDVADAFLAGVAEVKREIDQGFRKARA